MKKIFICLLLCTTVLCGCKQKSYLSSVSYDSLSETAEDSSDSGFSEETSNPGEQTDESKSGYVQILGAVNSPGVYEIGEDTRLFMVIEAAGGFREDALKESVNQAKPVSDGESIYIKSVDEVLEENTDSQSESEENDGRVNINKADLSELMTLSGIGESKARLIVDYRNEKGLFDSIEDIMKVEGIKEGTFNRIKNSIKV